MTERKIKRWQLALGILVIVSSAAVGIFKAVGCEQGAAVSGAIDDALKSAAPSRDEAAAGGTPGTAGTAGTEGGN